MLTGSVCIVNTSGPPKRSIAIALILFGTVIVLEWAWVELNYRPHAYQAGSHEHALRLEVLTGLHFTNILLSMSRI